MTGGSIISVSLAGRAFPVPADNDVNTQMGGLNNEEKVNGDGATGRTIKTRMPWKIGGLQVSTDPAAGDPAFLQALADGPNFAIAITYADDSVLNGTGNIQGELAWSSQNIVASLDLGGPGSLT